jgi:sugar phosphate permease
MLSFYFTKKNGILLSAWNGTSQLGDFISLITYYAIVNTREVPQQSFFLISFYLLVLIVLNAFLLPAHAPQEVTNEQPHLH